MVRSSVKISSFSLWSSSLLLLGVPCLNKRLDKMIQQSFTIFISWEGSKQINVNRALLILGTRDLKKDEEPFCDNSSQCFPLHNRGRWIPLKNLIPKVYLQMTCRNYCYLSISFDFFNHDSKVKFNVIQLGFETYVQNIPKALPQNGENFRTTYISVI